jgi:hypothetical protein
MIVARTEDYTYAAKVWDLSIVQAPFSVAPCRTVALRFATFSSLSTTHSAVGFLSVADWIWFGLRRTPR